jgi:hypothetical protein
MPFYSSTINNRIQKGSASAMSDNHIDVIEAFVDRHWQKSDHLDIALPAKVDIASARLPATYEQAKIALVSCEHIDECCEWANKAEALASYAKMADDDSLRQLADRIQARAVRRMGELLKQFDGRGGDQSKSDGTHTFASDQPSQKEVAARAGISKHQQTQAVRVANVSPEKFEAAIEQPNPATVTQLADMGRHSRSMEASIEAAGKHRRLIERTIRKDPALARAREVLRSLSSIWHVDDIAEMEPETYWQYLTLDGWDHSQQAVILDELIKKLKAVRRAMPMPVA